jgi:hypothetical protein
MSSKGTLHLCIFICMTSVSSFPLVNHCHEVVPVVISDAVNPSKYCRQQPRALRPLAFPTVRLPARVDRSRPLGSCLAEKFYPTCAFSQPQSLIYGASVERVRLVSEGIRLAPCVYEIGRRETRWRCTWFRLLPEGKIVNSHIILFPLLWRGRAWRRPCRRRVRRSRLPGRGGP